MIGIDSDCIIDFLKGKKEAVEIVEKHKEELATTEINIFEIYFGIYQKHVISNKEEKIADSFFNSINVFSFGNLGKDAANLMASLMKEGKVIEQNDIFIASIFKENQIKSIITRNAKHFSQIKDLEVISY